MTTRHCVALAACLAPLAPAAAADWPQRTGWGYVEGPLVDGDRVVCTPGGKGGTLLALDKRTGKVLWRTKEVTDKAPYSSIIVGDVGGVRHYIQMTDKGVVGVAPE